MGRGEALGAEYIGFTRNQADYVMRSLDSWLNVAEGGKRAGKNVINILAFAMCLESHRDKLHMAAGVTKGAARMNIVDSNGFGLKNFFRGRCREGKYEDKTALFIDTDAGEKVVIIEGGGRSCDAARIKGHSFGSVYISEVNEVHKNFFFEAMDRTLASADRRLFFDLNPKPPAHWFYREFLDRQDELKAQGINDGYNYGHFTVRDNLGIPRGRLENLLLSYDKDSNWYRSEILGKRVTAGGRIYTGFRREMLADARTFSSREYKQFGIGVDVGGTDATAATLLGISPEGEVSIIEGYYHKQGRGEGYTDDRYAEELTERIILWGGRFPKLFFSGAVFCESADKLFRQALKNSLRRRGVPLTVYPSYKKDGILDRIRLTGMLMNSGRFWICRDMAEWIEALDNAQWDDRALEAGRWARRDDGSCPVDCLDSMEYALVPFKQMLIGG